MGTVAELSLSVNEDTMNCALAWLEDTGSELSWPARTLFKMRLCLDEALTNILMYGYTDARSNTEAPRIKLRLQQRGDLLCLTVMDNGMEFDPTARPTREVDASLDDAQVGGHGLRLMRHYLQDIRYQRRNGWNHLELIAEVDQES